VIQIEARPMFTWLELIEVVFEHGGQDQPGGRPDNQACDMIQRRRPRSVVAVFLLWLELRLLANPLLCWNNGPHTVGIVPQKAAAARAHGRWAKGEMH